MPRTGKKIQGRASNHFRNHYEENVETYLSSAEIDEIQKQDDYMTDELGLPRSGPSVISRLCAQAKRYPAMVEALEKPAAEMFRWLDRCSLDPYAESAVRDFKRTLQAALKGETPQ